MRYSDLLIVILVANTPVSNGNCDCDYNRDFNLKKKKKKAAGLHSSQVHKLTFTLSRLKGC